jgi:RimJ/RimL family protein N-acetyltransferase
VSGAGFRLQTDRLDLSPAGPADAAEMFPLITPTLTRFLSFDPPSSEESLSAIVASWPLAMAAGTDLHMAVRRRSGGELLGMAGVHGMKTATPELGIWIGERWQGQGYGREAIGALANWAFATLRPQGLLYPVAERNEPSRRLVERLGGVVVGQRTHRKYLALVYRIAPPGNPR